MAKRTICSFANASNKPSRPNAIFQRGQYYVIDSTGKPDPYRYQIFINDSLLGLCRRKDLAQRFCQSVYVLFPFAEDVDKGSKTRSGEWLPLAFGGLTKKYRIKERPTMDVAQTTTKTKGTRKRKKSVARTTPGDQKPTATAAQIESIVKDVVQCNIQSAEGVQKLTAFKQTKAVKDAIKQVNAIQCTVERRQPTPEQRKLSRKDLSELDKRIAQLDEGMKKFDTEMKVPNNEIKALRELLLDLNLNVKRTAAVEKRIKAAKKALRRF